MKTSNGLLEGFVVIKSRRVCHRSIVGSIGEIFGYHVLENGRASYGVSVNGKDYELFENELEPVKVSA